MIITNALRILSFVALFSIASFSNAFAQATPVQNALTNNLTITEVVYEAGGVFYTQSAENVAPTSASSGTLTLDDNNEVKIYRITYDDGGTLKDVYPKDDDIDVTSFATEIVNNIAASGNIRVEESNDVTTNYDAPSGSFVSGGVFEQAMERVIAFPDIRSYWSVDGTGLGNNNDGGTGGGGTVYDDFINFDFYVRGTFNGTSGTRTFTEPDAIFLVTERDGNSPMLFTALDDGGGVINNANRVEVPASSGGDYQWNSGFENSNDNASGQTIHLHLFSNELFFDTNPNDAENIYGFQVDLNSSYADGAVLAFRNPQTRITGGECWRTLSSTPFDGATYAELLSDVWTQGVPGSNFPGAPESNVLLWDINEPSNPVGGWTTAGLDLTDPIPAGTGFLISIFADDDFNGSADDFPKVLEVEGQENDTDIEPNMNTNANGWTLLGNPYGAPLIFSEVAGNTNTNGITDVAYVYDRNASGTTNGNSGGWKTTNGSLAGDILNGRIAPFQGFFVQNDNSTSAEVEMQLDDRGVLEYGDSTTESWEFLGKSTPERIEHIRLEVEGEQLYNSAWISFADFGSTERIKGDAYELVPFSENYAMLSTRKGDELFDIGQFNYSDSLSIPLNLETTVSGRYTIRATRFDPSAGSNLVFIDTQENVTIPFDENFEYEFQITQASKSNPDPLQCGATAQELAAKFKPQKASPLSGGRFLIQHASIPTETSGSEQPSEFGLNQNYPNPFNPTTQISYTIPRQSDVRLEVFDMNGRQVATLVNQSMSAGTHTVNFDASDLSSGIYMYRLQAGSTVLTRKLTLVK